GPGHQQEREGDASSPLLSAKREGGQQSPHHLERHGQDREERRHLYRLPEARVRGEKHVVAETLEAVHVEGRHATVQRKPEHPDRRVQGKGAQRDQRRSEGQKPVKRLSAAPHSRRSRRKKSRRPRESAMSAHGGLTPTSGAYSS